MRTLTSIPAKDGFRMPAEFERHSGCWMLWPERSDNWRLGAKPAQAVFAAIAEAIAGGEPVTVGVSAAQFQNARARLSGAVRVVEISSNDAWIRDSGPTFVIDAKGRRRGVDWTFNAWGGLDGGLYFPWDRDDEVAHKVLEIEGADRYRTPFVLEGGAIHEWRRLRARTASGSGLRPRFPVPCAPPRRRGPRESTNRRQGRPRR